MYALGGMEVGRDIEAGVDSHVETQRFPLFFRDEKAIETRRFWWFFGVPFFQRRYLGLDPLFGGARHSRRRYLRIFTGESGRPREEQFRNVIPLRISSQEETEKGKEEGFLEFDQQIDRVRGR